MPFSRRQPRIAATGQVTIRLSPEQRDLLSHAPGTPQGLAHAMRRATVREGKLTVRVGREELDALIAAAAHVRPPDRKAERGLDSLLRYLESVADRFAAPDDEDEPPERSASQD